MSKDTKSGKTSETEGGELRVLLLSTAMIVAGGLFSVWLIGSTKVPPRSAAVETTPPVAQALVDVPPDAMTMDLAPPQEVAELSAVEPSEAAAAKELPQVGPPRKLTVAPGDTLSALLTRAPLSEADRRAVMTAMDSVFDARRLQPGQELDLAWSGAAVAPRLERLTLVVEGDDRVVVEATETGFAAKRPALAQRIAPPAPQVQPVAEPQPEGWQAIFSRNPRDEHPFLNPSEGREER